jgi:predicted HicB family RNase H-like nuclease
VNKLSYHGYMARVEFDADDGIFVGHIAGINDAVGFHGDNVADLIRAFHEAVDDYVAACKGAAKALGRRRRSLILRC